MSGSPLRARVRDPIHRFVARIPRLMSVGTHRKGLRLVSYRTLPKASVTMAMPCHAPELLVPPRERDLFRKDGLQPSGSWGTKAPVGLECAGNSSAVAGVTQRRTIESEKFRVCYDRAG